MTELKLPDAKAHVKYNEYWFPDLKKVCVLYFNILSYLFYSQNTSEFCEKLMRTYISPNNTYY